MNEEEITQAIDLPVTDEDDDDEDDDDDDNLENEAGVYNPLQTDGEDREAQYVANLSPDLLSAFKIVSSLTNPSNKSVNLPFMNPVEENGKSHRNYYQIIKKPMWLRKVYSKLLSLEYESITDVVADLRLLLENCYRYYGPNHPYVKRGLKMETILEQKLALLPSNLREQTTLEATSPRLAKTHAELKSQGLLQGSSQPGLTGARAQSAIFQVVREEKAERERERKRELMEMRKAEREAAHQETLRWEEALLAEHASDIRKMWELPQIGHFLYLAQRTLNLPEISQYELERAIFMPAGSSLIATVMTSLLSSPHQRAKLDQWPAMLYKTWESRLKTRIQHWYKVYTNKDRNLLKVFELLGIEPEFFRIMGDSNPMDTKTFPELKLKQRIWVLKSLCDYGLHNHKTVQDSILEVSYEDQREAYLGEDKEGNQYVHFPQFCGQTLRIYRTTKSTDIPELDLKAPPPTPQNEQACPGEDKQTVAADCEDAAAAATNGNSKGGKKGRKKGRRRSARVKKVEPAAKPQPPTFELVVESVEALRNLMDCFVEVEPKVTRRQSAKGKSSQPYCEKQLYRRLRNLLGELEPWEQKLEQAIIKSRLKLKKEWEDRRVKDAKQEEEVDNFWGMEIEEEVPQVNLESSSSSESDFEEDPNASEFRQTHRRTCTRRKRVWESESTSSGNESEPFKITVTSRGRICKMRNFNFVPVLDKPALPISASAAAKKAIKTTTKPVTVTLNGMQPKQRDMLESHRSQNSASDAQIQYQWETMRLKLLKENNTDTTSVKSELEAPAKSKVSVLKESKAVQNSSLDTDAFLSAPSDFGSWKSSVPGSAFTEQTFTTLLNHAPCYKPSPPSVSKPLQPGAARRVEFVKVTMPPRRAPIIKSAEPMPPNIQSYTINNMDKPKSNIFRDKNASGNDGRFVKTTFTAPGILRTTISKRPSQVSPQKTVTSSQSSFVRPSATVVASTSTVTTTTTTGTVIPSLAKPGQKILVLPIKDASGNKILLQVVPKGGQPLKLSQVRGMTHAVTKKLNEAKSGFPNNTISAQLSVGQQAIKNITYTPSQQMLVKRNQQLAPSSNQMQISNNVQVLQTQNQQLMKNQNQPMFPARAQQKLINQQMLTNRDQLVTNQVQRVLTIRDQQQQVLTNKERFVISHNQHLLTNRDQNLIPNENRQILATQQQLLSSLNQQLVTHQNQQLLHNEMTNHENENQQYLSSPTHAASIHSDPLLHAVTTEILQSPMSHELSENETLQNTMSHDLQTHQLLSQELTTNQMLHTSISDSQVLSQEVLTGHLLQEVASNHILHSPTHEHYAQNLSPPPNQLIATPTDHSQLMRTLQSANTAQLLASSLASQNQVIQTSPNQILSPVLANPDGTVTLLTQGSTGTVVLPVQTHIYAPQLYTSSEPKVIVCTNGQMLDGNMTSENLFVVTSNGQLVSMDNCAFQQTVLTEQMSPL